jgi:hypothetical protein
MKIFASNANVCTPRTEPITITLSPAEATALECILGFEDISPVFRKELGRVLGELKK